MTWRTAVHDSLLLRVSPFLIFCWFAAGLLVALCAPQFHIRHRTALIITVRLGFHLMPSIRNPDVGTALVLHRAAQPGARGAVQDMLLRTLTGNRSLPFLVLSSFAMLPPVTTLVMQAAMTALQWNSRGYCATPLLSDPLSQQRHAVLALALEQASMPLAAIQPLAGQLVPAAVLAGKADPVAVCHATHSFLHLFCGLLAPVFLSAWLWPPPPPCATAEARSSSRAGRRRKLRTAAQRVSAAATTHLRLATGASAGPVVRALVCWYVCANLWLCCKVAAGL